MALTSYSELQTAIASLLHRTDLTSAIPDWITLFEAEASRSISAAGKVARATASISGEYSAVPDDFDGVKTFDLATDPVTPLAFLPPDQMTRQRLLNPGAGKPLYYSVVGTEFRYAPTPDDTYSAELTYYQTIPALSATNTTNWLLTKHPDAYLYGSLVHSAPYLRDDPRLTVWASLLTNAMAGIASQDQRATYGTPLTMRGRVLG